MGIPLGRNLCFNSCAKNSSPCTLMADRKICISNLVAITISFGSLISSSTNRMCGVILITKIEEISGSKLLTSTSCDGKKECKFFLFLSSQNLEGASFPVELNVQ